MALRPIGHPPAKRPHPWDGRLGTSAAALAAKQLDPTVEPPPRLSVASLERPTHPVGRIAKKRLARLGRRLLLLD
jgi:hypothetical protein